MKEKFFRLLAYIIFNKRAPKNLSNQLKLVALLNYFTQNKLAHPRVHLYHLTQYLSGSFTTDEKRQALFHNYNYLKKRFSLIQLKKLFNEGVECYSEESPNGTYTIVLTGSSTLEFEGSLSLFLKLDNIKIATLSFSTVPGQLFDLKNTDVAYITCSQRIGQHKASIQIAIKYFRDIVPSFILMKSFEAVLSALKIDTCVGVAYTNQLTAIKNVNKDNYYSFYDERWINYGGVYKNGNYIIPLPLAQKPLLQIKQTHRNRAVKKRNKLKDIYDESFQKMNSFING